MKRKRAPSWDRAKSAAECARSELPRLAEEYFAAGRKAVKRRTKAETLHAFRLATKRFRYTLELFQPLYGPGLASRLEMLRRVQQYLGDFNDCVITRNLIRQTGGGDVAAKELLERLTEREKQRTRKLVQYWRQTFDAPGAEQGWLRYLRAWAGRRATKGVGVSAATPPAKGV
jgi:CHAD domain-containing protein